MKTCDELGRVPPVVEVGEDVDPARGFYRLNVHRRHLSTLVFKA